MGDWITGLTGIGDLLYQIYRDQSLTGAQREANAFTSSEADELRGWQEDMYNKYNSPQAMIRQFQDAGLNSALMYGDASHSAAPTSSSSPSSVTPSGGDITGALGMFASLQKLRSEIDLNRAQARNLDTQSWSTSQLTPAQVDEIASRISKNNQDVSESQARVDVLSSQCLLNQRELDWFDATRTVELLERQANIKLSDRRREEIDAHIRNLKQDTLLKAAQTAAAEANRGLLDAETTRALEQVGLIRAQVATEGTKADMYAAQAGLAAQQTANAETAQSGIYYEAALTKYNYDHADGNRIWSRIATGSSAIAGQRMAGAAQMNALGNVVTPYF